MPRDFVLVFVLICQLVESVSAGDGDKHEYYCPREELLIGKHCYKNMKSDVMKKETAEKHCKSLNKELPDSALNQTALSGWLQDTASSRDEVRDDYCIYSYPNPLGIASPDDPLFNIAPCSRKLHVLCSKQLQTGLKCEAGWTVVTLNTYKYCVKPSEKSSPAGETFIEDICPKGSNVFSFNYQDEKDSLTYEDAGTDSELLQPFWTPFYLTEGKTVDWFSKSDARHFETCLYKTGTLHVTPVSCDLVKQFHCQSPAKEVPHGGSVDPYDPEKDYVCNSDDGEVVCKNKCYKHWRTYKTQSDAEKNCTAAGSKLTSQPVSCIEYVTGWVEGSFENGKVSTTSSLSLIVDHCVYLHKGETKLADCRLRTNALYTVELEGEDDACPDSFHQCGDKLFCVGESTDQVTWSDAVNFVPRDRRRLLATKSALENCGDTVKEKLNKPLWVGAARSKGGVVEFSNGEELAVKSGKQCLKMQGGKLTTADCNTMMYFTCERPAAVFEDPEPSSNRAMVIALVVGPILILGVVLLLLYKKKGKEMCMSRSAGGVDESEVENGVTLTNPLADVGTQHNLSEDESSVSKSGKQRNDSLYTEVDI